MNLFFMRLGFIISVLLPLTVMASGAHEAPEGANFGPGMAVTDFNEEDGFKMSEKALENLEINFQVVKGNGPWKVPESAIMHLKQSTGVYRRYNGWISFILVTVLEKSNGQVTIKSQDLQSEDELAVSGVTFLRMTDADLSSKTVDSCAH